MTQQKTSYQVYGESYKWWKDTLKTFDDEKEANDFYDNLLQTGDYHLIQLAKTIDDLVREHNERDIL